MSFIDSKENFNYSINPDGNISNDLFTSKKFNNTYISNTSDKNFGGNSNIKINEFVLKKHKKK